MTARSNCVLFALPRWLRAAPAGDEDYLIIRRSRVRWGFCHVLHGRLDPATGQIAVTSYKPIVDAAKTSLEPVFEGHAVDGDRP